MTRWIVYPILLIASIEDIVERKVKNMLILSLFAVVVTEALVLMFSGQYQFLPDRIVAAVLVLFSFSAVAIRSEGVGGADIKAAVLLALHAGILRSILFILLSFLLMLVYFSVRRLGGRSSPSAPYVPFLSAAYITVIQLV